MSLKYKLFSVAAVVVLAVAIGTGLWYYNGKKAETKNVSAPYGSMTNYFPQKLTIDSMVKGTTGANAHKVAQALLDDELYKRMAKRLNVQVTSAAVTAQAKTNTGNNDVNTIGYLYVVTELGMNKAAVARVLTSGASGRYILYHFDQHMTVSGGPIDKSVAKLDPNQQQALVAADRAYALKLANIRYAALVAGTTTFAQSMLDELADPRLGKGPIPTLRQSSTFDTATNNDNVYTFTSQKQLHDAIMSTKQGHFTQVLTGQTPSEVGMHPKYADAYYVIFAVDSINQTATYGTVSQFEVASKKEYNYQVPTI